MATLPPVYSRKPVDIQGIDTLLTSLGTVALLLNRSMGYNGGSPIYDTDIHNGNWSAFYCITDCVFTAEVQSSMLNLDFGTWPAGTWIYGNHTRFQLVSGTLVAYNM